MKKIFQIAKLELSILFYSPIAWLILIIFIFQCGITFAGLLETREASQQLGQDLQNLTVDIFGGNRGFFASVQNNLYLYIPLLTMGLMSRELSSGSIKLLFSSPVTVTEIILGKFVSMMLYGLLLVLVLVLIVLAASISIESLDFGYLFGGILGLYFLICAYAAIGLFMSSLTSYQVVAAISTLAVFAALNFIGGIGQSIDFVRDITYWISIEGRADNFINGLISSKDVVYFILVIGLFLALSIMRLNSGRHTESQSVKVGRYAGLIVIVLAIGYFSSRPAFDGYYDTTRFHQNTLTENSRDLLDKLEEPLKITTYVNVINSFNMYGSPKWRIFDQKQFDKYTRFLPDLEMEYVTYYDSTMNSRDKTDMSLVDRAQRSATAYGFDFDEILTPEEIKKQIDLTPELNGFVREVEYKGETAKLRMFYDMLTYPHEAEISASVKRLLQPAPVVGMLTGNEERSTDKTGDKDYMDLTNTLNSRGALINQGFDVINVPIDTLDVLPTDLAALVIADPIEDYSAQDLAKLEAYIASGGNLMIAGEPRKQDKLNPLLQQFGIRFNEGTLLQESEKFELDLIQSSVAPEAAKFGISFREKDVVSLPGAVGINTDSSTYEVTPILVADSQVWTRLDPFNLETDTIVFRPGVDERSTAPVAVALTKEVNGKQQKIVVFGDADFMSNGELGRFNLRTKNYEFTNKVFGWFSDHEFPIDTTRPDPIDNKILVSAEEISWIEKFFLGFLPVTLGFAGGITLIRRKRK